MGMTVTVLGCSGGYPGPANACSGYLVRSEGTAVWLDAGSGTLANLQCHIDIDEIDVIVLTHEHPDHWRDIEGLYVAYKYGDRVREGVPVLAPRGLREFTYFDTEPIFAWRPVADGDSVELDGLQFSFSRTDHPVETLAVRIDGGGRSMAFSGDTGPKWSFTSLGDGIHLGLCEATLDDASEGTVQHLSGRQAGATATAANVEQLVLTHFWPTRDPVAIAASAKTTFNGPVIVAAVGEEYQV
jgi:ribonuclease BN (tRNA processing enzyme)